MWKALSSCDESIAPQIISIIQQTYLNKHHHSINASHGDFFDECNQRLRPFQETLSVISTQEGNNGEQGRQVALKIRRVLDVLRHYVANWPWLRARDDAVPLDQAWRGKPRRYKVQVNSKNYEASLHDNATIGQLETAVAALMGLNTDVYRLQLYADPNSANQPYEETHRVILARPNEAQINENQGVEFFGKVAQGHRNRPHPSASIHPNKALAKYPNFVSNLITLYDLALDLGHDELCSSVRLLLLILPADSSRLLTAIKKGVDFEPLLNPPSLATAWYNVMTLRMVLLPSDSASPGSSVYQHFFGTNGPHVLLRMLCSTRVSTTRHKPTRDSLRSALIELGRFVLLATAKRDEIDRQVTRRPSKHHRAILSVLISLDNFMFELAFGEAAKFRAKNYRPLQLDHRHFDGMMRLIWALATEPQQTDDMVHLFKLAFEMFILFGVVSPLSQVISLEKAVFIQSDDFLEFTLQMLLSPHDQVLYLELMKILEKKNKKTQN